MQCDVCGIQAEDIEPEAETERGMERVIEEHKRITNCHSCEMCKEPVSGFGHFDPREVSYSCQRRSTVSKDADAFIESIFALAAELEDEARQCLVAALAAVGVTDPAAIEVAWEAYQDKMDSFE